MLVGYKSVSSRSMWSFLCLIGRGYGLCRICCHGIFVLAIFLTFMITIRGCLTFVFRWKLAIIMLYIFYKVIYPYF